MDGVQVNKVLVLTVILTPVESLIRTCVGIRLQVSKLKTPLPGQFMCGKKVFCSFHDTTSNMIRYDG